MSADQEYSRVSGVDLLTANHPVTRAAAGTPGHRLGRFTLLAMGQSEVGVEPGAYLSLLSVLHWNGIRPIHEVWSSTVNLATLDPQGDEVGNAVMKGLATGSLRAGPDRHFGNLVEAVDRATLHLERRVAERRLELAQENAAFIETRRASFAEVHKRKLASLQRRGETLIEKKRSERVIRMNEGSIRKEHARFDAQVSGLESARSPILETTDLAVCVVEVTP